MPILIPNELPAYKILQEENIFLMEENRALSQDIRPIEIAIVNLMPTKIETETQLLRLLGNSPLQVNLTFITMETYESQNTSKNHLEQFYKGFSEIKNKKFDGMIVTGAPLEYHDYKDIKYIDELKEILEFTKSNVTSTLFICWGAFFALDYFYNIKKELSQKKLFGVYDILNISNYDPLLKGMDDILKVPMSRYTYLKEDDIMLCKNLQILGKSQECGSSIIKDLNFNRFFFTGHSEYDRNTLKQEYDRDIKKGLTTEKPKNYFIDEACTKVNMSWSTTANLLFYNWLNHYVYQITPYINL
ncbi:MAG: homoserine O-succinyltransferase [Lachnospirales bacterium]